MNLGAHIINKLLVEASTKTSGKIKRIVALYPGRFQPAGTHHFKTYKWITSQFDDVWVVTSDKVELPKSPLTFSDKKKIWNKHGVTKVAKVKNPYIATEVLSKYDPETTAVVFIVGSKDQERLSGKFFKKWDGIASIGYKEAAYTMIAPHISLRIDGFGEMSGTTIRKALSQNPNTPESKRIFKDIMGWYDSSLHKLIADKLHIKESIKSTVLLKEGGAAGHMSHPFDDKNLTFQDLKNIINLSLQGNLDMDSTVTEKCISGDSILFLEKLGPTKIKDVVDGNLDDAVLAYNSQDDKNEFLPIIHKFNNGDTDTWLVIELEDGKEIRVTPNHKIFVKGKGFVRADELTEDDELRIV